MTDEPTPVTAATEPDWIPEVDEAGDAPKATGRLIHRWTGETREAPAEAGDDAGYTVDRTTGEIRDHAGRSVGYIKGSKGDDSHGTAPDSTTQTADADAPDAPAGKASS